MSELCGRSLSCGRPALQREKLSEMWCKNDTSLIFYSKGESLCHAEMEQVLRVWDP